MCIVYTHVEDRCIHVKYTYVAYFRMFQCIHVVFFRALLYMFVYCSVYVLVLRTYGYSIHMCTESMLVEYRCIHVEYTHVYSYVYCIHTSIVYIHIHTYTLHHIICVSYTCMYSTHTCVGRVRGWESIHACRAYTRVHDLHVLFVALYICMYCIYACFVYLHVC